MIDDGESFLTNLSSRVDTHSQIKFAFSIYTRYIKIMPQSFEGHTSMRAGLLVNEDAFVLANVPGCDNKSNLENLGFCYLEKEGLTTYTYSISALKGSWTDVPPGCSL